MRHKELLSDMDVYPEVIQLIEFYFDEIKGKFSGDEFISAILGCGYSKFTDAQREQFIQKMEEVGEKMCMLPYRTQVEKDAVFEQRKRMEEESKKKVKSQFKQGGCFHTQEQIQVSNKKRDEIVEKDRLIQQQNDQKLIDQLSEREKEVLKKKSFLDEVKKEERRQKDWDEFQRSLITVSIFEQEGT